MTVTYRYLALANGTDRLLTSEGGKIILSWFFPTAPVFHKIQLLLPKLQFPIRIRITDLNK
jgi:hypothetical protein